ncbi:resuscitation-promoting factor [Ruania halotolerans]|uniref:resuscitation-promoting factor n=1 Tax=Ruania halotolerans TaxID=2897773 RepID=UPI001E5DDCEE|nr:resuscitation-promoting factor [Ruania halotolerans]UFU07397.1 transglycosylase family protein [Ruania halotolerans]
MSEPDEATTEEVSAEEATAEQPVRRARRRMLAGALAAVALVLGGGSVAFAAAHKHVEIDLDGQTYTHNTFAGSVSGLLAEAGIELGEHDEVVPGVGEPLRDDSEIVVRTASQITVMQDGEERQIWTTALTAAGALSDLAATGRDATLVASRSADGRTSLELPLAADGTVSIEVDGETRTVDAEGTVSLEQVLMRAEVELGPDDDAEVSHADGDVVVTVTRRSTERESETEAIEHRSTERETNELYEDQSRVVQEGQDGERTIVTVHQLVNGEISSSKEISSEVTTEPVTEIVEVGTAERPAPEPAPESSSSESSSSSSESSESSGGSSDAAGSGVWAALAQCESGGNPQAVSSNGLYYGLYQFAVSTWQSVGGSGLPTEASAAEQTQRAQALQARSGWGQWPHCASQLGLR